MKKRSVFIFVLITLALAACGAKAASTVAPGLEYANGGRQAVQATAAPAMPPLAESKAQDSSATGVGGGPGIIPSTGSENAPLHNRMVITNTDLTVVVANPQAKMDAIAQLVTEMNGWVVTMNMYQAYTQSGDIAPQGSISIRVPSDQMEAALKQIKAGVVEVRNETRSGQDVTSQYTDLQSQLTNLEQAETDLQAIMDEAKNNPNSNTTSKTQDVLSVYNQIVNVRGQIEQIKGQMKYYEQSSDTSLINVTLIAEETIQPIEIGGWKPQGVARDAVQALVRFLQVFVNFLIYLGLLILPVLIVIFGPIALIVWLIVALVKRRRARKAKAA
jgi:hypothetical protein